jgi:hypothetical protein
MNDRRGVHETQSFATVSFFPVSQPIPKNAVMSDPISD